MSDPCCSKVEIFVATVSRRVFTVTRRSGAFTLCVSSEVALTGLQVVPEMPVSGSSLISGGGTNPYFAGDARSSSFLGGGISGKIFTSFYV